MIKIRPYPIFAALLGILFATQTLFAVDVNWLNLVRQRLDLEQKSPEALIQQDISRPRKQVLDQAVILYHDAFEHFYKTIMPAFEGCNLSSNEWCDIKNYLESSREGLHHEHHDLQKCQRRIAVRLCPEDDDNIGCYQLKTKHYYNSIMDVIQKVIIEGQEKEVKLFKASVKEKRQERLQEKYADPSGAAILQETE